MRCGSHVGWFPLEKAIEFSQWHSTALRLRTQSMGGELGSLSYSDRQVQFGNFYRMKIHYVVGSSARSGTAYTANQMKNAKELHARAASYFPSRGTNERDFTSEDAMLQTLHFCNWPPESSSGSVVTQGLSGADLTSLPAWGGPLWSYSNLHPLTILRSLQDFALNVQTTVLY